MQGVEVNWSMWSRSKNGNIVFRKRRTHSKRSIDVQTGHALSHQYDLSAKNPNKKEETAFRQPQEILAAIRALDEESSMIMDNLQLIIENN